MANIARKPKAPAPVTDETTPDPTRFIEGAGSPPLEPAAESRKPKKERVVLHFDPDILDRLDRECSRRHISRGAMVRQLIAEHVPE